MKAVAFKLEVSVLECATRVLWDWAIAHAVALTNGFFD